ncbi:unnamed protein product, partial [Rotaria sordida]
SGDCSDLIGRFCTTAKLDLSNRDDPSLQSLFKWYEFKLGGKKSGELLALFELIQVNQETQKAGTICELEEIPITTDNYPPTSYITKTVKNKIYQIPLLLVPDFITYQIEILFWGLREYRPINLHDIQEVEVTIECAGAHIKKTIKDVQIDPNFESSPTETDKYTLFLNLPNDDNFWPHLSILCVQCRPFGMKEVVGNLVVTNLRTYLEKPISLSTSTGQAPTNSVNKSSKRISYDSNRVQKSVTDANEAVPVTGKDSLEKTKLVEFESNADRDSQVSIIHADSLAQKKGRDDESSGKPNKGKNRVKKSDLTFELPSNETHEDGSLTTLEKQKRNDMEKTAGWWHKYYASKAKLKLMQRRLLDMNAGLKDSYDAYAEFFEDESAPVAKQHLNLWNRAKQIFLRVGKAHKTLRALAAEKIEQLEESKKSKSAVDENFDLIEADRLKELTLLQTFDIFDTELENVYDYEGFNDCLDTFPLYKGKGSSRSDEVGDEKRIYAKFKVSIL